MPKRFIIFSVTYRFQRGFPHSVHSFGPPACLFRVFYFTILVLLARSLDFGRYWKCSSSTYFSITFIHIMLRFSGAKIRLPSSDPTSQSEKDLFSWKFSTSHMSTTTTNYWIRTSTQQVRNIFEHVHIQLWVEFGWGKASWNICKFQINNIWIQFIQCLLQTWISCGSVKFFICVVWWIRNGCMKFSTELDFSPNSICVWEIIYYDSR